MTTIDLNCDLGEGFGAWEMGNDAAMIELATSVNVACGFHAGDADIMRHTVELAKARGVSVGAHPGYRDLHGFGRRPIPGLKSSEIENLIAYQIGALQAIATAAGYKVTHVKAHGALSNVACEDDMTAKAIANGIKAVDPNLIFVVLANSRLVQAGEAANLPMVHEVFADRAYEDSGSLVSRRKPGAGTTFPAVPCIGSTKIAAPLFVVSSWILRRRNAIEAARHSASVSLANASRDRLAYGER